MPLIKSDYSISEAVEMISRRLPQEDALASLTNTLHAGEIDAYIINAETGASYQIPAYVWKSTDGRFVWSPSSGGARIHQKIVCRPFGYSAQPTGKWNRDGQFEPNVISGQVRIRRDRFDELLTEAASQKAGGRKIARASRNAAIIEAFLAIPDSKLSFEHGGLAAAVRRLAPDFPDYEPDTIRKIIEPDFRERKNRQNQ